MLEVLAGFGELAAIELLFFGIIHFSWQIVLLGLRSQERHAS